MMKSMYKWLVPVLFAFLLFACIRLATDIPKQQYYWEGNSMDFMLKEILPVIMACYVAIALQFFWIKRCVAKRLAWWLEYGFVVGCTLFFCIFVMWITRRMNGTTLHYEDLPIPAVISVLFFGFFHAFLRNRAVQKEYEIQQLQLEKIRNDQLQTELKFLKAQYHPHFLFNALNTVYFQIDETNKAPRLTLEILSDLLRYQLYNEGDKVPVSAEIAYLKKYVGLWQLRSSERLQLRMHFDEALQEQEIYPLLFVPLVENAFKYVNGAYRIALDMRLGSGRLLFHIENTLLPLPAPPPKKQGIGIENLQRRLELLYPGCHTLDIRKEETLFEAVLTIKL